MSAICDAKSAMLVLRGQIEEAPEGYPFVAAFLDSQSEVLQTVVFPGSLTEVPSAIYAQAEALGARRVILAVRYQGEREGAIRDLTPDIIELKRELAEEPLRGQLMDVLLVKGRNVYSCSEEMEFRLLRRRQIA